MFASRITKTVRTPSDPSYDVVIQRLSGRELEKAKKAVMFCGVDYLQKVGDVEVMRQIQALGGPEGITRAVDANPWQRYDRTEVLRSGIVSVSDDDWTAVVDDLEESVAGFLFREILRLSRVAVTEADRDE